jgi:hypothetical protein
MVRYTLEQRDFLYLTCVKCDLLESVGENFETKEFAAPKKIHNFVNKTRTGLSDRHDLNIHLENQWNV